MPVPIGQDDILITPVKMISENNVFTKPGSVIFNDQRGRADRHAVLSIIGGNLNIKHRSDMAPIGPLCVYPHS